MKTINSKQDLINYFEKGCKEENQVSIGVEHEKFVLHKDTFQPLKYDEKNGIKDILLRLSSKEWTPSYDDNQKTIVALTKGKESITLEPGGQIELSGAPLNNIHKTCSETTNHLIELKKLSDDFEFILRT